LVLFSEAVVATELKVRELFGGPFEGDVGERLETLVD